MGNKNTINNNDENEGYDFEVINNFLKKAILCTCKIILESKSGMGFFCKMLLGRNKELVKLLFTSYQILTEDILLSSNDIIIEYNNNNIILSKKHRKIYYNATLDYSCIEILDDDHISNFYYIDEPNLEKDFNPNCYLDQFIITFGLLNSSKIGLYNGLIKSIDNKTFIYKSSAFPGCSGGVILNPNSDCIVGLHLLKTENIEKNENDLNSNVGIFMWNIIDDINNKINSTITKEMMINEEDDIIDKIIIECSKEVVEQ